MTFYGVIGLWRESDRTWVIQLDADTMLRYNGTAVPLVEDSGEGSTVIFENTDD